MEITNTLSDEYVCNNTTAGNLIWNGNSGDILINIIILIINLLLTLLTFTK